MKKTIAIAAASILIASSLLSCQSTNKGKNAESKSIIWTTYNTEKILRDVTYDESDRMEAKISVSLAKGEDEGAQLIVSPDTNVGSYTLSVSDLTNTNSVIKSDTISLFKQVYIKTSKKSSANGKFDAGYYPDAIVPIQYIKEQKEDTIEKGKNQGFWLNFRTEAETKSGTYTGNATLTLDEKTYTIPIEVTVWDFDISATHSKTIFEYNDEWVINGEQENGVAMAQKYFDFYKSKRVSIDPIPLQDKDDVDSYVKKCLTLYDDPNVGSYNMIYKTIWRTTEIGRAMNDLDYDHVIKTVKALAKASTTKNLFSKLSMYLINIDEPTISNRVDEARYIYEMLKGRKQVGDEPAIKGAFQQAVDSLKAEAPHFFVGKPFTEKDILNIAVVTTEQYREALVDKVDVYCPSIDQYNDEATRSFYQDLANLNDSDSTNNKEQWVYTAWTPQNPYPTYHIDDDMISARTIGWMQYNYNLIGNLYWGTATYLDPTKSPVMPLDPYEEPLRYGDATVNGDGYLSYPAKKYNADEPISSLRLEMIRDGIEDYEYLWNMQTELDKVADLYGKQTANDIMKAIYDKLYTGAIVRYNHEDFKQAREMIANAIELLKSPAKGLIKLDNIDPSQNVANFTIYASAGTTVKIDGQEVKMDGNTGKATHSLKGNQFVTATFEADGYSKTMNWFAEDETVVLDNFDSFNAASSTWKVSSGTQAVEKKHIILSSDASHAVGGSAMKTEIAPFIAENEESTKAYSSDIFVPVADVFKDLKIDKINNLSLTVYNGSDRDVTINIVLVAPGGEKSIQMYVLKKGVENVITVGNISNIPWSNLNEVKYLSFRFSNFTSGKNLELYFDNLYVTKVQ